MDNFNFNIHIAENPNNKKYKWDDINFKVQKLFSYPHIEQMSKSWHDMKLLQTFVSASIIGAIVEPECHPYTSSEKLFLQKTNQCPPDLMNAAMLHGILNEEKAAFAYAQEKNEILFKFGLIVSNENKYIGVSPDRITISGKNVEIKTPYYDKVKNNETIDLLLTKLKYYWHQIQMQCFVTGLDKTDFVRYDNRHHNENTVLSIIEVPTDPTWWPTYKDKIMSFIDRVLKYRNDNPQWDKKIWHENIENERILKKALESNTNILNKKRTYNLLSDECPFQ